MSQFRQIVHDANIMGGKACIAGTRITVGTILMQISEGATFDEILAEYPPLTAEALSEALRYAAWTTGAREDVVASL